ncbi:glycosyltransferase family 2 protein [Candidatus Bathyarchaeota archaeon]|nr:glycosyltransferase family 2 protein [Candidatus Bathyarchaeota archaeon]
MTVNPMISVLIPTYRRAHLLKHVLEGLTKQTFKGFEVIVVLKPSGDGTESIVKKYEERLNIKQVTQNQGFIVDALNLGFQHVQGRIIVFLDDDAVPFPDFLQRHLESYVQGNVGGVAGDVIPANLTDKGLTPKNGELSEIVLRDKPFLDRIGRKIWAKPLEGLEDYFVYISKSGVVEYNYDVSRFASQQVVRSILGMGANMSVLSKAIKDFRFPRLWILGLAWEQFLGWYIWKKGYNVFFTPKAKVHHIAHGQTLTRHIRDAKKDMLRLIENNLLFYRLYETEPQLSKMHRVIWLVYVVLLSIKKICKDKELRRTTQLKSIFYSEIIGLKWLLSRRICGKYNPLADLEKFL